MSVPTVASLCASLPGALQLAESFDASDLEISAVHVSELLDPTSYLSGGELLLTTGLSLPDSEIGCEHYVSRLLAAGVSALGIGLGPTYATVPSALATACSNQGMCLLVVPPAAAFLTVSKAYWTARSRVVERALTDTITAHRSLVNAMISRDPLGETLKALSRSIEAWVARLDEAGIVEHVFPPSQAPKAKRVAGQLSNLQLAGLRSSATFPSGDDVVAVFPLALEDRVVGYVAIGSNKPMDATARRLVLTASALLSLESVQRHRADAAIHAQMQTVALLIDLGHTDSAHRLASRLGLPHLEDTMRLLVVRSTRPTDVSEAVLSWSPEAIPGQLEIGISWFLLPLVNDNLDPLVDRLLKLDPSSAAAMSSPVGLGAIHTARVNLFESINSVPAGTITIPDEANVEGDSLRAGIERVLNYKRADLADTFVAYLRHRGHWDAAAREIGAHRNTVRYRMGTVRQLLDHDPDEPDVSARAWLFLRANGFG